MNDYFSNYNITENLDTNQKIFFEASPPYLTGKAELKRIVRNIKNVIKNPKVIVCIRHPIYRSFSHYIHDLQRFSEFGAFAYQKPKFIFKEIYNLSFIESIIKQVNVGAKYYEKVNYLITELGKENVLFFFLEKDTINFDDFYMRLCHFAQINYKPYFKNKDLPTILPGSNFPRYFYASDKDLILESDSSFFKLKKDWLLLCNKNNKNVIFKNLSSDVASKIFISQNFWTQSLSKETAQKLYNIFFKEDMDKFIGLIQDKYETQYDLSLYQDYPFKDKFIESARLNHSFLVNKLQQITWNP